MKQAEFIEITADLEEFYDGNLTIKQKKEWFIALKEVKKEDYMNATREAYRRYKFMPKLSEILQLINDKTSKRDFCKYYINSTWCKVFKE